MVAAGAVEAAARAGLAPMPEPKLTPEGDAAAAKFTQQDNPRFKCETTNIIFDWTFDGPVNRIQQNRDKSSSTTAR